MPAPASVAPKPAPAKPVAAKPAAPKAAPPKAVAIAAAAKAPALPAFARAAMQAQMPAKPAAAAIPTAQSAPAAHPLALAKPALVRAAVAKPAEPVHPASSEAGRSLHSGKPAVSPHPLLQPGTMGSARPVEPMHPVAGHPLAQHGVPFAQPGVHHAQPGVHHAQPGHHLAHAVAAPLKLAPLAPSGAHSPGGQPLAPHIKEAIERSFLTDFSHVRVHLSPQAQKNAAALSARAFTFGHHIFLGSGEHAGDLALLAHEAAHVVHQQGGATAQAWSSDRNDRFEREADRASVAVQRGESFAVQQRVSAPRVQRLGLSDALDYFADKAYNIPGFRMFTIVLGVNPINMQQTDRSAANVLRAMVEFIPGGALITQALDRYSVLDKVGGWMQQQLDTLGIIGSSVRHALDDFLDSLSWKDIFHLGDLWDRAQHIFSDPITRIKNFAVGLLEGIWKFVRDAILKPLAGLASQTAGWDLLCAVLGTNPITGETVPRTAETLIGGFMKLIHEDEVWENIKKANAISRAWAWFQGTLTELMARVRQIPTLFMDTLHTLEWSDILNLPQGFRKVAVPFGTFLVGFVTWAADKVWTLLQLIFEVVAPAVMPYLKKVGASFKKILKDPIGFMHNLIAAGKLGFENFAAHFTTHLKTGLIDWLTGSLPGVYIPKAISLPEVGRFAMSVLGVSWAQIRGKIVKALGPNGETIMSVLEKTFDVVVALVKGGPAAAWELIKEKLTDLKDTVISGITSFVVDTIVKKAVPKIIAMFIPGAGFVSAILSIYDTVMVFVQKLSKIIAAVKAFLDSIMAIAAGQIEGAANKVESTLAGIISLAISFLAGFLGLGNIASKVLAVVEKIRATVDKALDTAINWIVTKAKGLWGAAKGAAGAIAGWWQDKQPFKAADGSSHTLLFKGDDETAPLVFQSTPTDLDVFLNNQKGFTEDQQKLAAAIRADIQKINTFRTFKKKDPTAADAAAVKQSRDAVAALLLSISQNLGKLIGGDDWGTESKPLPLAYPKPPGASYPPIYIGPRTTVSIPQAKLANAAGNKAAQEALAAELKNSSPASEQVWSKRGHGIEVFTSAVPKPLPDGGPTIGLSAIYQARVGQKLKLPDTAASTPGGGKINDALAKYGYDPSIEHTDGDHVVEMQLGGINDFPNLWPLSSRVNQQAGSRISSTKLPKPDGTTISMGELKKLAATREVWLVIAQTE
jgi:hypothetical protein